jgi:hypothetical protein
MGRPDQGEWCFILIGVDCMRFTYYSPRATRAMHEFDKLGLAPGGREEMRRLVVCTEE